MLVTVGWRLQGEDGQIDRKTATATDRCDRWTNGVHDGWRSLSIQTDSQHRHTKGRDREVAVESESNSGKMCGAANGGSNKR